MIKKYTANRCCATRTRRHKDISKAEDGNMDIYRKRKKLMILVLVLFTLFSGMMPRPQAYAELLNTSRPITDQALDEERNGRERISQMNEKWDLSDVSGDRIANSYVFQDCGTGKLYQNYQALIYLPNEINEDTKWGVFFPGGTGGWTLEYGYVRNYVKNWTPNAIYFFMGSPGIYGLDDQSTQKLAADLIRSVSKEIGWAPNKISVIGFSDGGYTALYMAAYLYDQFGIGLHRICILDMGLGWSKEEVLPSKEEAAPIKDSGAAVYHFSRPGELCSTTGARKFSGYGIPIRGIACTDGEHISIFTHAFENGMMSWAVGEDVELDKVQYK